jgi:hypothetical protein
LDIEVRGERTIVCAKTEQAVLFRARLPQDED